MRLSLKNMLISFVAALLVFAVVMTVVCIAIYRSGISERTDRDDEVMSTVLPVRQCRYDFSESTVYCSASGSELSFAVLAGVSEKDRVITVTPLSGLLPVNCENGIYYVSSVYREEGADCLIALAQALTGIVPDVTVNSDMFSFVVSDTLEGFVSQITDHILAQHEGYNVVRMDVLLDENGVADADRTFEQFFITESK